MEKNNKKKNSFAMLIEAAKNCRHEMWKAVQVLLAITLVLALVFYVVESAAQPDIYGGLKGIWSTMVWAFTQYIGDPGKFAVNGPVTFAGRMIATLIGIVKILIFAVPAGMIGSGFSKAIKDEKRAKELEENKEAIYKAFKREQCRHTKFRVVPRYKSLVSLQVSQNMKEEDIIDTVKEANNLRLRNLADTYSINDNAQDKLVVEIFPTAGTTQDGSEIIDTDYGCKIDRGSKVTIVSTSSTTEIGNSHFAYYLAQYGGFNFVSKEKDIDGSFYTVSDETKETSAFKAFLEDIKMKDKTVSNETEESKAFRDDIKNIGKTEWVIMILQIQRKVKSDFSFVSALLPKAQEKEGRNTTILKGNEETFKKIYEEAKDAIENKKYELNPGERDEVSDLHCDNNECFRGVGLSNIGVKTKLNSFTIRIAAEIIARNNRDIPLALCLAEIIKKNVCHETISEDDRKSWKSKGQNF